MDPLLQAQIAVVKHVNEFAATEDLINTDDLNLLWFTRAYDDYRIVFSNAVNDCLYDVTHRSEKKNTNIDTYDLIKSVEIDDDPIETLRQKLTGKSR